MTAKKRFELSIILALIFSVLLSFTSFSAYCNEIENGVLRLHILANSDSAKDQELKLAVRDSILENSENIFESASNKEDALKNAKENYKHCKKNNKRKWLQLQCFGRGRKMLL